MRGTLKMWGGRPITKLALCVAMMAGSVLAAPAVADPLSTAFNYQGILSNSGAPFSGDADVRFELFDDAVSGVQVGSSLLLLGETLSDGRVTTDLDFGPGSFTGDARWLQISIRTPPWDGMGAEPPFTVLSPRQSITAAPYALYALSGNPGPQGPEGPMGPVGPMGPAGPIGPTGATGAQGPMGLTGATGAQGPIGLTGPQGPQGIQGVQGPIGPQGPAGDTHWLINGSATYYPTGNVGIGTSAPSSKLHVFAGNILADVGTSTAATASLTLTGARSSTSNVVGSLIFRNFDSNGALLVPYDAAYVRTSNADGNDSGNLGFFTKATADAAPVQRAVISTSGNLGLGVSSPSHPLTVNNANGLLIGSVATGFTNLEIKLSAAEDGYAQLQSVQASGSVWGNLMLNPINGRVGVGTVTPGANKLTVDANGFNTAVEVNSNIAGGVAIVANSTALTGNSVAGDFSNESSGGSGVYARANSTTGVTYGVRGVTSSTSAGAAGVRGEAPSSSSTNYGVYGSATGATAFGVYANGRLGASGTKSFMIDHPLDPENKVLLHYSAESPDVLNIYSGNIELDANGEAWVTLPEYFESINSDPRYTLTSIGAAAPLLHIAEEVQGNQFKIGGGAPGRKVSWEIKAKRTDRFVTQRGAPTERLKTDGEQGKYLEPALYGKPDEMGIFFAPPKSKTPTAEIELPAAQ